LKNSKAGGCMMEFDTIRDVVAEQMDIDKDSITAETKFADDLNADSLDILQIIDSLESIFGMEFDNEAADKIRTVGDAAVYIQKALA